MAFIAPRRIPPKVTELPHEVYAREEPTTDPAAVADCAAAKVPLPSDVQFYADRDARQPLERVRWCHSRPTRRARSIVRSGFRYRLVWIA